MKEERITNVTIRQGFFNIPKMKHQIARRQLTFIGKVVRKSDDQLPTKLLTAWCNHKRKKSGVLQNNKKTIAHNLQLIIPRTSRDGLMASWFYFAIDQVYWEHLLSTLGNRPKPSPLNASTPNSTPNQNPTPPTPRSPPRHHASPPVLRRESTHPTSPTSSFKPPYP